VKGTERRFDARISRNPRGDPGRSWIRKMFEEGALLMAEKGPDNVFDFSLGNPYGDPPPPLAREIARLAENPPPDLHKYMPNAGFPDVRQKVADDLRRDTGLPFTTGQIVMTVGAAGRSTWRCGRSCREATR
jgi:aspartate aminotransferase